MGVDRDTCTSYAAHMDRRRRASEAYQSESSRKPSKRKPSDSEGAHTASGDQPPVSGREAGFNKTIDRAAPPPAESTARSPGEGVTEPGDSIARVLGDGNLDRAARLLIAMGTDRAARVISHLDTTEVEAVTRAIMETEHVSRGELAGVSEPAASDHTLRGGPEVARQMLVAAFGEEEGERRFFVTVPNAPEHHFAFLNDLEPAQIHAALRDESPGVVSLVIAHIDRTLAAAAFATLSADLQPVVARRIARMGRLSRSTVVQVEAALREKIRTIGTHRSTDHAGGSAQLAAIIRHLPPAEADAIVSELDGVDPQMADAIRRELLTADVLEMLRPRDLADLLREFDEKEIALLLKGKREELRAAVLRAVSDRRAADISEEFAHLGPQTREDVDRVTFEVLQRLREREQDGSLLVPREGDRYI